MAAIIPPSDFPVDWADPADADLSWGWDDMHMPTAMAPLAADYIRTLAGGFAYGYQGIPVETRVQVFNGYAYFNFRVNVPAADKPATLERLTQTYRDHIQVADAYWRERVIPELRSIYERMAAQPIETLAPGPLADAWDDAWAATGRCWSIHFYAIRGPYQALEDLADLYESIVEGAPPGEALSLAAGGVHELHDVERQLESLTALATATPPLAAGIVDGSITVADLEGRPDAAPFRTALDSFLAEHGHLGQSHDDLALPSWAEDPDQLLRELAKRLEHPATIDVEARRERLAARAQELADAVRARLADDPDRLATFEVALAAARLIGPLTEVHNYWIDRRAQAELRRFVMRVGRRLAEAGTIADDADILYLRRDEVRELIGTPADRRAVVTERRAEHARWSTIRPPDRLGVPLENDEPDRFDGARITSTEPDELRGTGASAGVVRGPARVTLSGEDFGSVQPGDIIVCPSSNPSWVPIFAIAGGLITDTGGVLSHAAVVAREFALPAVVGTGDATRRIADGRLVELDGTSGIVRLL